MSFSSTDSLSSNSLSFSRRSSTHYDLRTRALDLFTAIRNPEEHSIAETYVAPNALFTPGDCSSPMPLTDFLEHWERKRNAHPGLRMEVVEAMEDEDQRKVLIMSSIQGLPDVTRARAVDMVAFDENGYITGGSLGWMHFKKPRTESE